MNNTYIYKEELNLLGYWYFLNFIFEKQYIYIYL